MRHRGWIIAGTLLVGIVGALAFFAHRLLFTQAGLDFALSQLNRLQGLRIEITGAKGTLAGPLAADRIVVDHEAAYIDLRGLRVVSVPRTLLTGRVTLTDLVVERLSVRLKERPEQPKTEPRFLPSGLSIHAPAFRIGRIDVTLQGGQRIDADEARGNLTVTRWRIDVDPLSVRAPQGGIEGSLALRATDPLGLRTNLRGEWKFPQDAFEYRFRVETRGRLDRLATDLYLDAPAKLSFSGTLLDLTERPRARGTFRIVNFDGSPWMPPDRLPSLSGTISLAAGLKGLGFDGTLTSPALPGQQLRLQGSGRFAARTIEVASFRAWLPRLGSSFTTSGTVQLPAEGAPDGALPKITMSGEWSALRWPLDEKAEPVVTSPQGLYTFEGSMPYAFTARAELAGAAIPSTSLDARGAVDRAGLRLERVDGYTMRGRVQGRGSLQWTGAQPWSFDVDARSLVLTELRPGVEGRVSARGTISGTGLSAEAPWTARLTSMSGTMFGRPLTGHGEIAHRAGVFELRRVRLANGASFADVDGKIGADAMDLRWNVDLRSLAIVAKGMGGRLVSRGTARGTPTRPVVVASARAGDFSYAGVLVREADADVDLDASDRRRSRVSIEARDVSTSALDFDFVRAGLDGLLSDHQFVFAFASPGTPDRRIAELRGGLVADGSLDVAKRLWNGTLTQADVVFPDGEARLIQPAAMTLGTSLQRASPICLRTANDARLCVEGEHHPQPQTWRVIYSAQDWPLQRVLRSLLGWKEFDGRLQASGWAEKTPGHDWVGGSTVLVHEPSFEMPRNKFRTERIQLGSSRLDLYVEPREMRATVDLEVDETTQVRGEAFAERRSDVLTSPLRGRIEGRSEAIRVLPLLVPEIDRAAGRVDGEVSLAGTLGEPQFNGNFHLRDGRIELYRTNLIVSALQADGTFSGDEFRFDATGQTARGKLTVDGNFAWPQGVMTGAMRLRGDDLLVADTPDFRVIASPDITVYAGIAGYHVEGAVQIPSARISPRNITSSVGTSPDERVVGLPDVEETEPSTTNRITSKIKVVLGDAVRVDAYGLKARLEGDVTVSTVPDDVARGNGIISVADGLYKAFGQEVTITKGLLKYVNAPLSEPQLEIVAERKIKDSDITVAVNVRGTLDNPFISITSTPAMPSNEALSYLLTGRSIDMLQSGEAASVNQAAENLALSGGGLLLGSLGTKLGLDEVSVERTADEDTEVVLGKAISPKLFVSYGISIAEAINTIKLRYTLNDRWSIKAESGLEQSADVEYRIER